MPVAIDGEQRYLAEIGAVIAFSWDGFVAACALLPRDHPLNRRELQVEALLMIAADGSVTARSLSSSGNRDFDHGVGDVLVDITHLPPPPRSRMSDDGRVHVRWLFRRQVTPAPWTRARILQVRLPTSDVVARLLADGDVEGAAAAVLERETVGGGATALAAQVFERVVVDAVEHGPPETALLAIDAAGAITGDAVSRILVRVARSSYHGTRAAALRQLALRSPTEAAELAAELVAGAPVSEEVLAASAEAMIRGGRQAQLEQLIAQRLSEKDGQVVAGLTLAAAGRLPLPLDQVTMLARDPRAAVRALACRAIAPQWHDLTMRPLLRRAVADPDTLVRLTCAEALGRVAAGDRPSYSTLLERTADRDRAVRSVALLAMARVDPLRARRELARLDARGALSGLDPAVVAQALALLVPTTDPLFSSYLHHERPEVRAAAVAVAVQLGDSESTTALATMVSDDAAQVRAVAVFAVGAVAVLRGLALDPALEVRSAALQRLAVVLGGDVAAHELLRVVRSKSRQQAVIAAAAWLRARAAGAQTSGEGGHRGGGDPPSSR
jgi:HEAT repeat protein